MLEGSGSGNYNVRGKVAQVMDRVAKLQVKTTILYKEVRCLETYSIKSSE